MDEDTQADASLAMYQAQLDYENSKRYFLKLGEGSWKHVTKAEWVSAERSAGFHGGRPGEPSTAGFSNSYVEGMIFNIKYSDVASYEKWLPEYAVAVKAMIEKETE